MNGRFFLVPLMIFLVVHFFLRLAFSPSLEPDDADLAIYGQSLAWGYSDQGPLYSWLLAPLFEVFGVGVVALTVMRFAILGLICWAIRGCTLRLTDDLTLANLAGFSPMLVPTFIWHAVIYLTHTNLLCLMTLLSFWQMLRLHHSGSIANYVLFGVVLGLGGLTKYNFAIAAVALVGGGLMLPGFRRRLLHPKLLISAAIALLMVTPHLLWLSANWDHIAGLLAKKTGVGHAGWSLGAVALGLWELLTNVVLIPLLLVITFAWWFRRGIPRDSAVVRSGPEGLRLLECFAGLVLCWFVVQALMGGTNVHERWLQPYFILLPVYLFAKLSTVEIPPIRVRRYAQVLATMAVVLTVARGAMVFVGGRDDGTYPLQMRFEGVAEEMKPAIEGADLLIAGDREIGGNLAMHFPDARTVCTFRPAYVPPRSGPERTCVLVWNTVYGDAVPYYLSEALKRYPYELRRFGEVRYVDLPPLLPGKPVNRLGYVTAEIGPTETAKR